MSQAVFPFTIFEARDEAGRRLGVEFVQQCSDCQEVVVYHLSDKHPAPRSGRCSGAVGRLMVYDSKGK